MKKAWIGAALLVGLGTLSSVGSGSLVQLALWAERSRAELRADERVVGTERIRFLRARPEVEPTIVMVHGFAADKDNWTRFARHFPDYGLLIPDLPGHGESSRNPTSVYDVQSQAQWLIQLLDELPVGRFHLVGNSMGGQISAVVATQVPERVLSLGLFNSSGVVSPEPSEFTQIIDSTNVNPLLAESVADYDRLMRFAFVDPPFLPPPIKRHFARRAIENRPFNDKIYADAWERYPIALEPLLGAISAPTLVLWGDTDRIVSPSVVPILERFIPKARTVIMESCGHAPMIERPEECARHYRSFLATSAK